MLPWCLRLAITVVAANEEICRQFIKLSDLNSVSWSIVYILVFHLSREINIVAAANGLLYIYSQLCIISIRKNLMLSHNYLFLIT